MKASTQVTITPLTLAALQDAVNMMKWQLNSPAMLEAVKAENEVGVICRGAIANGIAHRAILKRLIQTATEGLEAS